MRPWYETSSDLEAENAVAGEILGLTSKYKDWLNDLGAGFMADIAMRKLPVMTYKLDWCATRGKNIMAWAELKRRKITFNQYPDIMISVHKMAAGRELAIHTGINFVIFIAFLDGLGFHVVDLDKTYPMEYGGRTVATRDSADIEPVCYIGVDQFFLFG